VSETPEDTNSGAGLARGWLENSPFVAHLGIELESMEPDRARLRLPYSDHLPTMGEVVHGGAISSLIDTAAAWSGADVPERPRASTVGININFLARARGEDVTADAHVIRRGQVSVIEVSVTAADGTEVARALVTYRL
jgi:uncharacterized protein (TIGR00369 family)